MVKIYAMKALWVGDENVFKNLRPKVPEKWGNETLEKQKRGESLDMKWAIDATDKSIADFIMFPGAGLASTKEIVNHFKMRFAPGNMVNSITLDGEESPYALLQPKNYTADAAGLEHIFMMFPLYKNLLITQPVKDEWERRDLTGAVFQEVAEIDDERFIPVVEPNQ